MTTSDQRSLGTNMSGSRPQRNLQAIRDGLSWLSPSWRWERARMLAKHGERCQPMIDDEWTRQALIFQTHKAAGMADEEILLQGRRLDTIMSATRIASEQELECVAIEACLISLEPVETIAARIGTSAEVVTAYEMLFCDFRSRHDGHSWMCDRVIRGHIFLNRPQSLRTAVLTLAYKGGPVIADQVLSTIARFSQPSTWDTISQVAHDEPQSRIA